MKLIKHKKEASNGKERTLNKKVTEEMFAMSGKFLE